MWKRIELHNHTIESDGIMTVKELVQYLNQQEIYTFSLTDHNTISGLLKLKEACDNQGSPMEYINGCELTSYYGHLLCQNISSYISWDDINEDFADLLFHRVHEAGGLAGPAHPFSIPSPFSNGMRWSMNIHDYHLVDFIEVINNGHPMVPDNQEAILWWENLIFSGYRICPVTGMDLHRPVCMSNFYTTYIQVKEEDAYLPLSSQFDHAVRSCSACVTKGPVFNWERNQSHLKLFLEGDCLPADHSYLCQLRTKDKSYTLPLEHGCCTMDLSDILSTSKAATVMLFEKQAELSYLTAIARPFFV